MGSTEHPDGERDDGSTTDWSTGDAASIVGEYHIGTTKRSAGIGWNRWSARELRTGTTASGPIEVVALLLLVGRVTLGSDSEASDDARDPEAVWREVTAETKRRFDEEDVTEDDVEDAIEWARSR